MTSNQVIELAKQVYSTDKWTDAQLERLQRFAELVRAEALNEQDGVAYDALRAALDAPVQQPAPAMEPCKGCNGTGEVETGIGMMTCDECHGTGVQPRKAVKLSDQELLAVFKDSTGYHMPPIGDEGKFARAIEQAIWVKLGVTE